MYTISLFYLHFFFYCYGHHRDLHSFPTRRSSDLLGAAGLLFGFMTRGLLIGVALPAAGVGLSWAVLAGSSPDRKSTRLNSSHPSISYAVFCLKKKKINRVIL